MACVNRLNVKFGELKQKGEVREFRRNEFESNWN